MPAIVIPAALRRHMQHPLSEVEVEAATVGEAIEALVEAHPELSGSLYAEGGGLSPVLRVFARGESIDQLEGLATPVGPREEILLLPPIAGG